MRGAAIRAWLLGITAALVLWSPEISRACAVCFAGSGEEARKAFVNMTVFLTFLPLLAIGGVIWWLRRRAHQLSTRLSRAESSSRASASGC